VIAELSFDLVMEDDMAFVEGTFRLPGRDWQVVIVSRSDLPEPEVIPQCWDSGATGVIVRFPNSARLNQSAVEHVLSSAFGIRDWIIVRGPDSMKLR
jgi:hypothetical protein